MYRPLEDKEKQFLKNLEQGIFPNPENEDDVEVVISILSRDQEAMDMFGVPDFDKPEA